MDQSTPSYNTILKINQFIKGNLNLSSAELERLYHYLVKQFSKDQKKIDKQIIILQNHMLKIKAVKLALKRNNETLQKAFFPTSDNVSLLYKKQGKQFYIKARIYWVGHQREVQVGSIPNVIKIINRIIISLLI